MDKNLKLQIANHDVTESSPAAIDAKRKAFEQERAYLLLLSWSSFFFHNTTIPAAAATTAIPETLEFNQCAGGRILLNMPTILNLRRAQPPSLPLLWTGLDYEETG